MTQLTSKPCSGWRWCLAISAVQMTEVYWTAQFRAEELDLTRRPVEVSCIVLSRAERWGCVKIWKIRWMSAVNSTDREKNILATMSECTMHQFHENLTENFGWRKAVKQTVVPSGNGKGSSNIVHAIYTLFSFFLFCRLILYLYLLLLYFGHEQRIQWFIVAGLW